MPIHPVDAAIFPWMRRVVVGFILWEPCNSSNSCEDNLFKTDSINSNRKK